MFIIVVSLGSCMELEMCIRDSPIALAGNPNVGKSSIFNALTGLHQHTGNWPGKTVAVAHGTYSVSYTHLDVYKRQRLDNTYWPTSKRCSWNLEPGTYYLSVAPLSARRVQTPVSYTHLDVYKRQGATSMMPML